MLEKTHLSGADGLRGFACIIVMACHSAIAVSDDVIPYLVGCAKIGVWLFFVLSAYLLTLRLKAGETLLDYSLGRIIRICPLFFLALVAHKAIGLWEPPTAPSFWEVATFQGGFMHLWTIPVEMAFYVVLPLVLPPLIVIRTRWGDTAMIAVVIAAIIVNQWFFPFWLTPTTDSINLGWYLPTFLFGIVAALLINRVAPTWLRSAIVLTVIVGIVLAIPGVRESILGYRINPPDLPDKHLFFGVAFALLIWCVVGKPDNAIGRVFDHPLLSLAGRVSYPTYLFNFVVLTEIAWKWPKSPLWTVPAHVAATFVAGWIVHVTLETWLNMFRRSLAEWLVSRHSAANQ